MRIKRISQAAAQHRRTRFLFIRGSWRSRVVSDGHSEEAVRTTLARLRCGEGEWVCRSLFDSGDAGRVTRINELRSDRLPGRIGPREPVANASHDADWHGLETAGRCRARGKTHRGCMQEVPGSFHVVAANCGGDIYGTSARNLR